MRLAAAISLALCASSALAQDLAGCTKLERQSVTEALRNAKRLTLAAAAAVGDTPEYARWFGKYTPHQSDAVRGRLKAIYTAIRSGRVRTECANVGFGACARTTYAFVYADEPYRVYVCPHYFTLPTMASLDPDSGSGDNGTREGTFIHEISHFVAVAGTEDHCYSRTECSWMAETDVIAAIENADSYQYFTEDVTLARRSTAATKPED